MEWQHIEALVEKYWEGETSLEEEQTLRQALQRSDVPEGLRREAELMGMWAAEQEQMLSPSREAALLRIPYTQETQGTKPKGKGIRMNSLWLQVAATVVIAAGLFFWNLQGDRPEDPMGQLLSLQEDADPGETYDEVRDALLFISLKFKQGAEPMEHLQEINHAQQPLQQLKRFNRAEEIIEEKSN